jgi:hypothetical protein
MLSLFLYIIFSKTAFSGTPSELCYLVVFDSDNSYSIASRKSITNCGEGELGLGSKVNVKHGTKMFQASIMNIGK